MISKNIAPPLDVVERASEQLRQLLLSGASGGCESVLDSFPDLRADRDSVLELIYLEYVLRRDRDANLETGVLVEEYVRRFPEHADEIVKLLQVDIAFNSLNSEERNLQSGDVSGESIDKWGPSFSTIGDYRLLEVLGQGGMGIVYRAVQKRLGRAVAIKTIQATADLDSATILRFRKEAELASSLQHPNIAQIYEVGTHNEIPFYSMEYVPAGSLAQFLRDRPLKPELAANLVAVLARAVDYAHSQGVIHRDLKPANVLLSPSTRPEAIEIPDSRKAQDSKANKPSETNERYEPKIVDFGLAIHLSSIGQTRLEPAIGQARAVGTPSYMAPEQVDPSIGLAGPSTDVYALGSILFHALVGRPPFYAASTQETLRQVCHDDPTPPSELQPKIASDLETICLKCLRKVPTTRYHTAIELADDLQRYLQGKPIHARPASMPERVYKWGVRNPSLVTLMAAMLVAVLLTTWLWRRSEQSLTAELAERRRSEQLDYDRNITLAYHEFKSHNVERALDLLKQCPVPFRGWEWYFVKTICEECIWECQSGEMTMRLVTAGLSPDAQYVAAGYGHWGYDHEQFIHVWRTDRTDLLWKLQGHPPSQVSYVNFHPTKPRLLSSAISWQSTKQPGSVIEWDLQTGQKIRTIDDNNVHISIYSRNGQWIFVGDTSGNVKVYDVETGQVRWQNRRQHRQMVLGMCESSDGRYLATTGRDGTIAVWCTNTGRLIFGMDKMGDPRIISWSPDMKKLVVCGFGGRVDVFRWEDDAMKHESTYSRSNTQIMTFSPDGQNYASAVQGESTDLRDAEYGKIVRTFFGHRGQVRAMCFDQYGRKLLTAGADGTCRLWDMTKLDGYIKRSLGSEGLVEAIDYHPTSPKFALAMSVQRSKASARSGVPRVEIWDSIRNVRLGDLVGHRDWLTTVRFSSDGQRIVSGARDKTVRIWDANKYTQLALLEGHQERIVMAAFWNIGKTVSVDGGGLLKIWDNQSHKALASWNILQSGSGDEMAITACAMDEHAGVLAAAQPGLISFWDLTKKEKITTIPFADRVRDLRFSWDGKRLGVASSNPEIALYDVSTLVGLHTVPEPQRLRGHIRQVTALSFSPDNKRLAAAGLDESLGIFELDLGNEVLMIDDNLGINNRVAFSRDGRQLTTCEGRVIYTYSLDRLDHKAGQSPERAVTTWHVENYGASMRRNNPHAALFHARALVERSPDETAHRFYLSESLADLGQFQESIRAVDSLSPKRTLDRFSRLEHLLRAHILTKNLEAIHASCLEYERLAEKSNNIEKWNNLAWFAALGNVTAIDLGRPAKLLEGRITKAEKEIVALDLKARNLAKLSRTTEPLDEQLTSLGLVRTDLGLTPTTIADKKKLIQREISILCNTLGLTYYRLGDYEKAYRSSQKSLDNHNVAQPLDYIIQAMALCRLEFKTPVDDESNSQNLASQALNVLLPARQPKINQLMTKIDQWFETERKKEITVEKSSMQEFRLQQMDIPILMKELELLLPKSL